MADVFVLPVVTPSPPLDATPAVLRDIERRSQPFAATVPVRGVRGTVLRLRHALRHARWRCRRRRGTLLASVLGGPPLTETVFGRAGWGKSPRCD